MQQQPLYDKSNPLSNPLCYYERGNSSDVHSWITDCALQIFVDCLYGGSNVLHVYTEKYEYGREGFLVEW